MPKDDGLKKLLEDVDVSRVVSERVGRMHVHEGGPSAEASSAAAEAGAEERTSLARTQVGPSPDAKTRTGAVPPHLLEQSQPSVVRPLAGGETARVSSTPQPESRPEADAAEHPETSAAGERASTSASGRSTQDASSRDDTPPPPLPDLAALYGFGPPAPGPMELSKQNKRYEPVYKLGQGGMAEVFRARQVGPGKFEREVAIKRILANHLDDSAFHNMLLDEAWLSGQLRHRNIIPVTDIFQYEQGIWLVMEYVEGLNLRQVLRKAAQKGARLTPNFVCYVGAEVADALHYAHRLKNRDGQPLNVVHRDVSPSNVMVAATGDVKLFDFGIAFSTAEERLDRTVANTFKGKYSYVSPEQASGLPLDGRSDQWSLAIVLVEALTGWLVFRSKSEDELLDLIRAASPVTVDNAVGHLPPGLQSILKRALSGSRLERYETCADFAQALREYILSTGVVYGAAQAAAEIEALEALPDADLGPGQPKRPFPEPAVAPLPSRSPQSGTVRLAQGAKAAQDTLKPGAHRPAVVALAAVLLVAAAAVGAFWGARRVVRPGPAGDEAAASPRPEVQPTTASPGVPASGPSAGAVVQEAPRRPSAAAPAAAKAPAVASRPAEGAARSALGAAPAAAPPSPPESEPQASAAPSPGAGEVPEAPPREQPRQPTVASAMTASFADGVRTGAGVTLGKGTSLAACLSSAVDGSSTGAFNAAVSEDVAVGGEVVVPRGSTLECEAEGAQAGRVAARCNTLSTAERTAPLVSHVVGRDRRPGLKQMLGSAGLPAGSCFYVVLDVDW